MCVCECFVCCRINSLEDAPVDLRECASHRMFKEQLWKNYAYIYAYITCVLVYLYL